ncbi:hypothetical protein ABPG72_003653 [Tetrahymena utriculariae]
MQKTSDNLFFIKIYIETSLQSVMQEMSKMNELMNEERKKGKQEGRQNVLIRLVLEMNSEIFQLNNTCINEETPKSINFFVQEQSKSLLIKRWIQNIDKQKKTIKCLLQSIQKNYQLKKQQKILKIHMIQQRSERRGIVTNSLGIRSNFKQGIMIQFILISKQTNQKIYQEFQKNFFCCERQKNKQLAIYRANKNNDKKTYIFSLRKYKIYSLNIQAQILTQFQRVINNH